MGCLRGREIGTRARCVIDETGAYVGRCMLGQGRGMETRFFFFFAFYCLRRLEGVGRYAGGEEGIVVCGTGNE